MRSPADACVEVPETRSACRRGPSRPAALLLVVVLGIEFNGIEEIDNLRLLAALDVLVQSFGDRRLFGAVATDPLSLIQQPVINREVRSHERYFTHRCV